MRYEFGKNWQAFVKNALTPERCEIARCCLLDTLLLPDLEGKNFLDVGCGSGIHSLAAWRSGARRVISFDYDEDAVRAARWLWEREGKPANWKILRGDVLDKNFMSQFGDIDIAYAWGVLHHTGDTYKAIEHAVLPVLKNGSGVFFCALYSHYAYETVGGTTPAEWLDIKKRYNKAGMLGKRMMEVQYRRKQFFKESGLRGIYSGFKNLMANHAHSLQSRGMAWITEVRDWLGGWPMDFVRECEVVSFCQERFGLRLARMLTGEGNTEFLFAKGKTWLDPLFASRHSLTLPPPFAPNDSAPQPCMVWRASLPQWARYADTARESRRSTLLVWEDGRCLSFPHCRYINMRHFGCGRYRHWEDSLYFTTSDNSDPNTNGRAYTVTLDDPAVMAEMRHTTQR